MGAPCRTAAAQAERRLVWSRKEEGRKRDGPLWLCWAGAAESFFFLFRFIHFFHLLCYKVSPCLVLLLLISEGSTTRQLQKVKEVVASWERPELQLGKGVFVGVLTCRPP
jgi:hypothetical protein